MTLFFGYDFTSFCRKLLRACTKNLHKSLWKKEKKTVFVKQHKQPKRFLIVWGNNFVSERFLPLHEKSGIVEKGRNIRFRDDDDKWKELFYRHFICIIQL